jgi:hypothetical protein
MNPGPSIMSVSRCLDRAPTFSSSCLRKRQHLTGFASTSLRACDASLSSIQQLAIGARLQHSAFRDGRHVGISRLHLDLIVAWSPWTPREERDALGSRCRRQKAEVEHARALKPEVLRSQQRENDPAASCCRQNSCASELIKRLCSSQLRRGGASVGDATSHPFPGLLSIFVPSKLQHPTSHAHKRNTGQKCAVHF